MSLSQPRQNITITGELPTAPLSPVRVLMLGLQNDNISNEKVLIQNIGTNGEENTLFGANSQLAGMVRSFRRSNKTTSLDAIPYNQGTSASPNNALQATASIDVGFVPNTLTTAPEAGTISFEIVTVFDGGKFDVPVLVGDTPLVLGDRIAATINGITNLPVGATASVANDVITILLAADLNGNHGNFYSLRTLSNIGSVFSVIVGPTGFTGGSDGTALIDPAPELTSNQVKNIRYQYVVFSNNFNPASIKSFVESRWPANNVILDGVSVTSYIGNQGGVKSYSAVDNSFNMINIGLERLTATPSGTATGGPIVETMGNIMSQWAAVKSALLDPNANISDLIVSPQLFGTLFGGIWTTGLPYHNTPLALLPVGDVNRGWSNDQQVDLLNNGVSFIGNNSSNTETIFSDVVTTNINPPDPRNAVFKFLNTVEIASAIREYFFVNNKQEYAQATLTQGTPTAPYQFNIDDFRRYQLKLYQQLSEPPYSLVPNGSTFNQLFEQNLVTTVDLNTGVITVAMVIEPTVPLRGIDTAITITYQLNNTTG